MPNETEYKLRRLTDNVVTAGQVVERLEALIVRLEKAVDSFSALSRGSALECGSPASQNKKKEAAPKFRYDKKEAAEQLGVCVRTLDPLIKLGYLPAVRTGAKVYVLESDLSRVAKMDLPSVWNEYYGR